MNEKCWYCGAEHEDWKPRFTCGTGSKKHRSRKCYERERTQIQQANADYRKTIARLEARVVELEEIVREVAEDDCYETLGVGDGCGQCIACRSRKLLNHPAIPDSSPCKKCSVKRVVPAARTVAGTSGDTPCPACHGSGREGDHA